MTRVVAIDGPAGSGKSSVSRQTARRLGYGFLDTGAAYRALTWWVLDLEIDPTDHDAVAALLPDFPYSISVDPDLEHIRVGEVEVTEAIREPRISLNVSAIATNPRVREWMKTFTRQLVDNAGYPGIVAEGRDMTTVVFPDAETRILLTAREEVRIARRAGETVAAADVTAKSITERDAKDSTVVDFMNAAPGVTVVDSSDIDFNQTVDTVVGLCTGGNA
jgi:cytidylate kinase